jgi:hypoxanthine phosphoribosyltransferase
MPKVPVYEQGQVNVARTPDVGQGAKFSAEAVGGGAGNAVNAVLDTAPMISKIYQEQKQKADQIAVSEADAKLAKLETDLLFNPKTGALNSRGKNSFDVGVVTNDEYQKSSQAILDTLSNDDQKLAFKKIALDRGGNVDRALNRHMSQESIRYDTEVTTSLVKNEQDAAIQNYADPGRVAQSLKKQEQTLREFANRNGISDESLQQQLVKAKSETHENVLNRMLSNDQDLGAMSYFKKYKNDIDPERLARIEQTLDVSSSRILSQRKVDEFIDKGLSMGAAYEEAEKVKDPKLREAVEQRISRQYAIKENAEKDALEKTHVNALNILDQTKDINEVIKNMPNEWNSFDVTKRNSLIEYAKKKTEGRDVTTDPAAFYELKLMSSAKDTRDEFISMDLTRYRNKLSDKDWRDLVGDQTALRNKDGRVEAKLDGFMSQQKVISEGFEKAGFNKKDKNELFRYNFIIDQEIATQAQTLGRKLNNEEVRKVVNDYTLDVVTKENKFWFDSKKKLFELNSDEIKTIKYKDIPSSDKLMAEQALRKKGLPVTEDRVRQLFINKYISRGR